MKRTTKQLTIRKEKQSVTRYLMTGSIALAIMATTLIGCGANDAQAERNAQGTIDVAITDISQPDGGSLEAVVDTARSLPEFSVDTLTDNIVDNTIFQDYALTVINVWGTFCEPCITEMPMLQTMSQNMPEGTQLIGIVCDVVGDDTAYAKEILRDTGVTYPNLIAEGALLEFIDEIIVGNPSTFFVDGNGNLVGEPFLGERSPEEYDRIIKERVAMSQG